MDSRLPVAVFDSGVGGLGVLKALETLLPHEDFVYFGDTARMPYGPKSPETVIRYSLEAAAHFAESGFKALVIACNTATVAALDTLSAVYPDRPVLGVVEAGAREAAESSRNGHIALIATSGTVRSNAHERIILGLRPDARISAQACPLLVNLAEEGWLDNSAGTAVAREYLEPLFRGEAAERPDTLLLGCTHFPLLAKSILRALDYPVNLVDPAEGTARSLQRVLRAGTLLRAEGRGKSRFAVSAEAERFARVGSIFMGREIAPEEIELVRLGGG